MRPIRLAAGVLTVGIWTLVSRVFGFARDILMAAFMGSGPVAEAFLVAFALPNMFRRFFAEGAFNTAFVPLFSKKLEAKEDAANFAQDAFAALAVLLIIFVLIAMAAMPWLVLAMASGFAGDERFDMAVGYGRITFVYILFISLSALLSGVLNVTGRFAAAAAAPVLLNILLLGALILAHRAYPAGTEARLYGLFLTWGVPVAGIAQLALVWVAAARAGIRLLPQIPKLTPDVKRLAIIAAPAMLAGGVVQINLLVGRQIASFFDGAIVWLGIADRLYQLPLGVVGIAIGIVLLPDLSRRLCAGDGAGGRKALSRAGEISMALTVPAAVALMVIPLPLVSVLFERGAFGADDTAATALALAVYGAGLPAFVLQKVLQPVYFAREDTRTPFRYALVAMVVNAVVAVGLAWVIGFLGAPIGTTVAAWVMVWLLARGTRPMGKVAHFDDRFRRRSGRIILASVIMGVILWGLMLLIGPLSGTGSWRYLVLAAMVMAGGVSYLGIGQALNAFHLSEFRAALHRP
ncbi:MAG: murein biosynthesis integral membrane protein MurJ [Rhodobacteraceae bacterium]|nr:murein biosynthesis integral membrane protein MurJ [Paracoccaceae bacterium]